MPAGEFYDLSPDEWHAIARARIDLDRLENFRAGLMPAVFESAFSKGKRRQPLDYFRPRARTLEVIAAEMDQWVAVVRSRKKKVKH